MPGLDCGISCRAVDGLELCGLDDDEDDESCDCVPNRSSLPELRRMWGGACRSGGELLDIVVVGCGCEEAGGREKEEEGAREDGGDPQSRSVCGGCLAEGVCFEGKSP